MLCEVCGIHEVPDEGDHCADCVMRGLHFEHFLLSDERGNMLQRIRDMEHVLSANVWHVGAGRYLLAVYLTDNRLVVPGWARPIPEAGNGSSTRRAIVVPGIPPNGEFWGVRVMSGDRSRDQEEEVELPGLLTDDDLVEKIDQLLFEPA